MRELWTQPVGGAARQTLGAGADYIVATDWAVDMPRELEQMGDRIAGFSVASNGTIVALRLIEDGKPPLSVVVNWQKMLGE